MNKIVESWELLALFSPMSSYL